MMFSDNENYAMALNKHRLTAYRINRDNSDETNFNKYNHGAIWDSKTLSQQAYGTLTPEQAKNKYSKSLVLEDNQYYIENFDGNKTVLAELPDINAHRNLSKVGIVGVGYQTCGEFTLICHIRKDEDYYESGNNNTYEVYTEVSANAHNSNVTAGEFDSKDQWFEMEGEDDPEGNFKKGDNTVKRSYTKGGQTKTVVHWSTSNGEIKTDGKIRRFLLEDFMYDQEQGSDKITTNNWLHDNEIMYSANREHRILHHKGIIVSQQKDMPVVDNQEIWRDKWVVDSTNPSSPYYSAGFKNYDEHRLLLTRDGQMQYVAVDAEDESNVLESINIGGDCDGVGTDGDYEFQLHDNGRLLTYNGDNLHNFFIIDESNSTSNLNTQKKLISILQPPNGNEVNIIVSPDGSKYSFIDGELIKVIEKTTSGADVCLNKTPIQVYNIAN